MNYCPRGSATTGGWFMALLLAAFLAGCSGNGNGGGGGGVGGNADTTAPTVSSTTVPAQLATGVEVNVSLAATFSEAMNPSTITPATFILKEGITIVPGAVSYVGRIAIFDPTNDLSASTIYTATITTGAQDLAGNALANDYVWSFTTGTTADTSVPNVSTTLPVSTATNVAVNENIAVAFSETMNPVTITSATFVLREGSNIVPGTVTSSSTTTAAFNPTNDLVVDTIYTATVTTGVQDLAGNALAADYVWSFTTVAAIGTGPQPVGLGLAGNFVILTKAGVSTTGTTAVTGDIGVSPIDSTALTGFSLALDSTGTFSTSSTPGLVTGKLYAADYASPTPSNLTTTIENMETAYTDAAGRTTPAPVTELGAGNITGMDLAPGLYKWGTGLAIDAAGVTLTGGPNDVWIFQIAQGLTVANGARIALAGGALPKNIFWQAYGAVTLGTTAHMEGVILSKTEITLATGATVNGRLLSQTAVTLDANTVTQPAP